MIPNHICIYIKLFITLLIMNTVFYEDRNVRSFVNSRKLCLSRQIIKYHANDNNGLT